MNADTLRNNILAAVERGAQPHLEDVAALLKLDPVLAAAVEVAVKGLVEMTRYRTLIARCRQKVITV